MWYLLLQLSTQHFIEQIQSFTKWVFEKQFLQIFSFVEKSILSFTSSILNLWQCLSRCFSLYSQHVRPFFLSFCFSDSSEAPSLSFLSLLAFVKLEYIFFLKFYFGDCCCFVLASWMEIILASGLKKSLICLSNQF